MDDLRLEDKDVQEMKDLGLSINTQNKFYGGVIRDSMALSREN